MDTKKYPRSILLQNAIGDWTTFRPAITEKRKPKPSIRGSARLSDNELFRTRMVFLNLFEEYLSNLQRNLNLPFVLNSVSIDQMTTNDILKEIDASVAQFKITLPEGDSWQICFDSLIANLLIHLSVGGEISSSIPKSFTEIEENILSISAKIGLEALTRQKQDDIALEFINFPSIFFDQTYSETLPYIVLTFEVAFGRDQKGFIFVIIPSKEIHSLMENVENKKLSYSHDILTPQMTQKIFVPISVQLGTAYISAKDLYEIESGDVLMLDSSINSMLSIKFAKDLQLFGQPGIKEGKVSIQIFQNKKQKLEKIKKENIEQEEIPEHFEETQEELGEKEEFQEEVLSENLQEETISEEQIEGEIVDTNDEMSSDSLEEENIEIPEETPIDDIPAENENNN